MYGNQDLTNTVWPQGPSACNSSPLSKAFLVNSALNPPAAPPYHGPPVSPVVFERAGDLTQSDAHRGISRRPQILPQPPSPKDHLAWIAVASATTSTPKSTTKAAKIANSFHIGANGDSSDRSSSSLWEKEKRKLLETLKSRIFTRTAVQPPNSETYKARLEHPETSQNAMCIVSVFQRSPKRQLSAKEICKKIMRSDPRYKQQCHNGWQASILQELARNPAFDPVAVRRAGRKADRIKWQMSTRDDVGFEACKAPSETSYELPSSDWVHEMSNLAPVELLVCSTPRVEMPVRGELFPSHPREMPDEKDPHFFAFSELPVEETSISSTLPIIPGEELQEAEDAGPQMADRPQPPPVFHTSLFSGPDHRYDSVYKPKLHALSGSAGTISTEVGLNASPIEGVTYSPSPSESSWLDLSDENDSTSEQNLDECSTRLNSSRSRDIREGQIGDREELEDHVRTVVSPSHEVDHLHGKSLYGQVCHVTLARLQGDSDHNPDRSKQTQKRVTQCSPEHNSPSNPYIPKKISDEKNNHNHDGKKNGDDDDYDGGDQGGGSESDNDGDDGGNGRKRKKPSPRHEGQKGKQFVCPYHADDPFTFSVSTNNVKFIDCIHKPFPYISEVLRHIERVHRVFYCSLCVRRFTDKGAHDEHKSGCYAKPTGSKEERWYQIWDVEFPGKPRPSTPYHIASSCGLNEAGSSYRQSLSSQLCSNPSAPFARPVSCNKAQSDNNYPWSDDFDRVTSTLRMLSDRMTSLEDKFRQHTLSQQSSPCQPSDNLEGGSHDDGDHMAVNGDTYNLDSELACDSAHDLPYTNDFLLQPWP